MDAISNTPFADSRARPVRAPRGPALTCANWQIEAAYRMIQNNLDREVAENPDELVVYGGIGKAARNWACFDAILDSLRKLKPDETLLVQSGKPVGVFRTHTDAPRVLIANSNLVPRWATWEHFNELDQKGLMMYGQMTAGSWIYIGSQGIVQGTYETFAEAGRQHFGGSLAGRWVLTAGLGGMGGAQPLAATFAGACSLIVECQQTSIDFRLRTKYLDKQAKDLDEALALIAHHTARKEAVSIGLCANAADVVPQLAAMAKAGGIRPDIVTDQTSAHDLINGYLPSGWSVEQWQAGPARPGAARGAEAGRRRIVRAPCAGDAGIPCDGHPHGGLRQQPAPGGQGFRRAQCIRLSGFRARLRAAPVLPRRRPVPLGGAQRRPAGHPQDRRQDEGAVPAQRRPAPLAGHGAGTHQLPGPAVPHLLDRAGRSPPRRPGLQRDGAHAANSRRRS